MFEVQQGSESSPLIMTRDKCRVWRDLRLELARGRDGSQRTTTL